MKNYKYFLFDWDGCLAETLNIILNAYKQVFHEYKLNPTDNEITEKVFGSWTGPLNVGLGKENLDNYTKKLVSIFNTNLQNAKLNPNAMKILNELKSKNKKIAVLTTSSRKTIMPTLINNHLEKIFDVIITMEDVSKQKPNPESVFKAINLLQGKLNETIIIGDSSKDIELANNAKVDSILYYYPEYHKKFYNFEKLKALSPTYIINDFLELQKYF